MSISSKIALITGGTRGIGLGVADALAGLGINLVLNGQRSETDVEDTLRDLRSRNIEVLYCRGNIADAAFRISMIEAIKTKFGRIDFLINNAGVAPKVRLDLLETTEESYDFVMDTNLKSNFFLTQTIANWMIEQSNQLSDYQPCIINISSISATVASVNRGEYCVSKAGIAMNTQLFATKLAEFGISVFEIRPGVIQTDMTAGVSQKYDNLIDGGLTLQKRWGQPADIGRAVAALVKGDFPYSTGSVFMIDGGLTVPRL